MDLTTRNILDLMNERDISQADLVKEKLISNGMVTQWKKGLTSPSKKTLKKLADYFNVSVDYLLGRDEQKKASAETETLEKLFRSYGITPEQFEALPENKKQLLFNLIQDMIESNK